MTNSELRQGYAQDEILLLVRKLNTMYDDAFQWGCRCAQKEHTDLFGKVIKHGDRYWRIRMGGDYINDLKLSDSSMERFLFVLFAPHPKWEIEATVKIEEDMQQVRNIINHIRK